MYNCGRRRGREVGDRVNCKCTPSWLGKWSTADDLAIAKHARKKSLQGDGHAALPDAPDLTPRRPRRPRRPRPRPWARSSRAQRPSSAGSGASMTRRSPASPRAGGATPPARWSASAPLQPPGSRCAHRGCNGAARAAPASRSVALRYASCARPWQSRSTTASTRPSPSTQSGHPKEVQPIAHQSPKGQQEAPRATPATRTPLHPLRQQWSSPSSATASAQQPPPPTLHGTSGERFQR
mmetsp:Transcript_90629/g.240742  ORF Transcript_90629/g.240742 Transcript_90629/m.240742 type:complete len:238 (-) Transcript_90629:153-866(-)